MLAGDQRDSKDGASFLIYSTSKRTYEMSFNPESKLMKMRGKDYLEVKWRIVWFREENPKGGIVTELANTDPVLMKATVTDNDGVILGTGFGTPKQQGVAAKRPFEGAETAAIGRALAIAGYGTQFTGEDEGNHLSDAPVERDAGKKAQAPVWKPETIKAIIDAGYSKNSHSVMNTIAKTQLHPSYGDKWILLWFKFYRAARDMNFDSDRAVEKATKEYIEAVNAVKEN